uniref:Ion_trans domain-containing protein n=1 Tax=Heterorhabditis bacteriophora TaxID=37862 RepID=A0A1I7WAZ8_HETBA
MLSQECFDYDASYRKILFLYRIKHYFILTNKQLSIDDTTYFIYIFRIYGWWFISVINYLGIYLLEFSHCNNFSGIMSMIIIINDFFQTVTRAMHLLSETMSHVEQLAVPHATVNNKIL